MPEAPPFIVDHTSLPPLADALVRNHGLQGARDVVFREVADMKRTNGENCPPGNRVYRFWMWSGVLRILNTRLGINH